jgi:GTPase SAR1 family protein
MQDVGGRSELRPYWRHYYTGTQGVVFVVDASDASRISTAASELAAMAADDQLAGVPFAVLANKAGQPGALTRDELVTRLALITTLGTGGAGAESRSADSATAHSHERKWELHLVTGPLAPAALQPAIDFLLANMHRI